MWTHGKNSRKKVSGAVDTGARTTDLGILKSKLVRFLRVLQSPNAQTGEHSFQSTREPAPYQLPEQAPCSTSGQDSLPCPSPEMTLQAPGLLFLTYLITFAKTFIMRFSLHLCIYSQDMDIKKKKPHYSIVHIRNWSPRKSKRKAIKLVWLILSNTVLSITGASPKTAYIKCMQP